MQFLAFGLHKKGMRQGFTSNYFDCFIETAPRGDMRKAALTLLILILAGFSSSLYCETHTRSASASHFTSDFFSRGSHGNTKSENRVYSGTISQPDLSVNSRRRAVTPTSRKPAVPPVFAEASRAYRSQVVTVDRSRRRGRGALDAEGEGLVDAAIAANYTISDGLNGAGLARSLSEVRGRLGPTATTGDVKSYVTERMRTIQGNTFNETSHTSALETFSRNWADFQPITASRPAPPADPAGQTAERTVVGPGVDESGTATDEPEDYPGMDYGKLSDLIWDGKARDSGKAWEELQKREKEAKEELGRMGRNGNQAMAAKDYMDRMREEENKEGATEEAKREAWAGRSEAIADMLRGMGEKARNKYMRDMHQKEKDGGELTPFERDVARFYKELDDPNSPAYAAYQKHMGPNGIEQRYYKALDGAVEVKEGKYSVRSDAAAGKFARDWHFRDHDGAGIIMRQYQQDGGDRDVAKKSLVAISRKKGDYREVTFNGVGKDGSPRNIRYVMSANPTDAELKAIIESMNKEFDRAVVRGAMQSKEDIDGLQYAGVGPDGEIVESPTRDELVEAIKPEEGEPGTDTDDDPADPADPAPSGSSSQISRQET